MTADQITAVATVAVAVATAALVLVTAFLALAAVRQIPLVKAQLDAITRQIEDSARAEAAVQARHREFLQDQHERQRSIETLRACVSFGIDPVLSGCMRRMWQASAQGTQYKRDGTVDLHDVFTVANYLDGIAIGVLQGLFSDEIAKDHLGVFVRRFVEVILPTLSDLDGYEALVAVHTRWFPRVPNVTYTAKP